MLTLTISPAATVTPESRNIKRPNSRTSLYSSTHIGRDVSIVTMAVVFFTRQRGFFFITSPVTLCSCAFSFVITTGSTKLRRCNVICKENVI